MTRSTECVEGSITVRGFFCRHGDHGMHVEHIIGYSYVCQTMKVTGHVHFIRREESATDLLLWRGTQF